MASDVSVLSRLVDDLFLLAQIESSRLTLERVRIDLAEIADEAIEALAPTAATRAVEMQMVTEGAVIVSGDRVALGRVLRNLLDNAVRHTPAGSTVRVEVAARPAPSVRVVDEGDGFHPNFVGDAFHSFTRLDESRNRRTGGAGLGLTIAKGLIDAHGGSITIEPPPGGRVRVDLPPADSGQALPPGRQAT
jgi:signal transduction histidine kinase